MERFVAAYSLRKRAVANKKRISKYDFRSKTTTNQQTSKKLPTPLAPKCLVRRLGLIHLSSSTVSGRERRATTANAKTTPTGDFHLTARRRTRVCTLKKCYVIIEHIDLKKLKKSKHLLANFICNCHFYSPYLTHFKSHTHV